MFGTILQSKLVLIHTSESSEYIESGEIEGSLASEEEHFLKVCHNKKRVCILLVLSPRIKGQPFQAYGKM